MPANNTNRTNLASVEAAINALETNSSGTSEAERGLRVLCQSLKRTIAVARRNVSGLA